VAERQAAEEEQARASGHAEGFAAALSHSFADATLLHARCWRSRWKPSWRWSGRPRRRSRRRRKPLPHIQMLARVPSDSISHVILGWY